MTHSRLGNVGISSECLFRARNQRISSAISGMLIEIATDIHYPERNPEIDGYLEECVGANFSQNVGRDAF